MSTTQSKSQLKRINRREALAKKRARRPQTYVPQWPSAETTLRRLVYEKKIASFVVRHERCVQVEVPTPPVPAPTLPENLQSLTPIKQVIPAAPPIKTIFSMTLSSFRQLGQGQLLSRGGKTTATVTIGDGQVLATTAARCHPTETFSRREGRLRALDQLINDMRQMQPTWFRQSRSALASAVPTEPSAQAEASA